MQSRIEYSGEDHRLRVCSYLCISTISPSNAEGTFDQSTRAESVTFFEKTLSKPYHFGIHCIALAEYSHMSIHVPGFQSF